MTSTSQDLGSQGPIGTLPVGGSVVIYTTPNTANVVGPYTDNATVVSTYTDDHQTTVHPNSTNPTNAFFSNPGVCLFLL